MMQYRPFGKEQIKISEIGLGCWQLGSGWGEAVPEETAFEILKNAVDQGVNFFDTADVYGAGRSESLIGQFLDQSKADVFVATKLGRNGDLYPDRYSEENIRMCVENSLTRLKTDSLDLIQLHCIPLEVMKGDVFDILRQLQSEGLIQRFAASIESMEEAKYLINTVDGLYSLQLIFNIFRHKPIHTIFNLALKKQVALIIRVPLASGLLTGKFTPESTFASNDHRTYNEGGRSFNAGETFAGLPFDKGIEMADMIKTMVPDSMSMAQFSLRWILDHPAVSVVIPGAKNPKQLAENNSASDLPPLSKEIHQQLAELYENEIHHHIMGVY